MLMRLAILLLGLPGLLPGQDSVSAEVPPKVDSSGIPYALIEGASSLGLVKAYNPNYGFGVVSLASGVSLKRGDSVAARRDGVIICRGAVESVESTGTVVIQFAPFTPDPESPSRVRVGDSLIVYPPPPLSSKP